MAEVLSSEEIDQLLTAINKGETKPEDFRPARDSRKIKLYDFKRPDRFSRDQIRNVSIVHESFARLVTAYTSAKCRAMCHAHVASVDQLTYDEFIRSIPTPTTLAVIDMQPLKGYAALEIDPACTFAILDRILGGPGDLLEHQHELTDIEKSIITGVIQKIIGNLREAWQPLLDLQPKLERMETNPQFLQIVPPTEMVILVSIEYKISDVEGMINLCVPYLTVESILGKLSANGLYSLHECYSKTNDTQKIDSKKLDGLKKTIMAEYLRKEMTIGQLSVLLNTKGIITIEDRAPYTGKLFMDDVCIGEFSVNNVCDCRTESSHIKINILNKECKLEKNYMDEKNNVKELNGTLKDIKVQLIAELGRTMRNLGDVSSIGEGTIIELDKLAGEPIDLYANNVRIAVGEVVVIDEKFGIRITDVVKEE